MSKCKYCKKEISEGSIRCMDCNSVWEEGRKHGRLEIKSKIKEILNHITNLGDLSQ